MALFLFRFIQEQRPCKRNLIVSLYCTAYCTGHYASFSCIFTGRNEVGPRYCFYRCLWFCPQRGGVYLSACWDTPPWADTPLRTRHPWTRHPPGADTPRTKYAPQGLSTPPRTKYTLGLSTPPGLSTFPLPQETDSGIQSMSGRCASYWNAISFYTKLVQPINNWTTQL